MSQDSFNSSAIPPGIPGTLRRLTVAGALCVLVACSPAQEEGADAPATKIANASTAAGEQKLWVTSERLDRHTCPSTSCGVVGRLFFRESVTVHEERGDWSRVTKAYDAACSNGVSDFVDRGNDQCVAENGIVDGQFSEWVERRRLSATRPADPAETASAAEQYVKDSDDFARHRQAFSKAAANLIADGQCTSADLIENGGFVKSTNNPDGPIYFTYCGGFTSANRIYLNAATGETYR